MDYGSSKSFSSVSESSGSGGSGSGGSGVLPPESSGSLSSGSLPSVPGGGSGGSGSLGSGGSGGSETSGSGSLGDKWYCVMITYYDNPELNPGNEAYGYQVMQGSSIPQDGLPDGEGHWLVYTILKGPFGTAEECVPCPDEI